MDASIFAVCEILRYQKRRFSQFSRQTLASDNGKRLAQVTVASCGTTKAGSFAFRAPARFLELWTIQPGVSHSEGLKTSRSELPRVRRAIKAKTGPILSASGSFQFALPANRCFQSHRAGNSEILTMGAFLQSSRQGFASYRGKRMGEVTVVVVAS